MKEIIRYFRLIKRCIMKLKLFAFVFWIFPVVLAHAQDIKFFKGSFEEACQKAKEEHKLIYILVSQDRGIKLDEVTAPPQRIAELAAHYRSEFICLAVAAKPGTRTEWGTADFTITKYPSHLFFDANGGLLYRSFGFSTSPKKYLEDIRRARSNANGETLSKYLAEFSAGNRNNEFLKNYLLKNEELGLSVDQTLLDAYALSLSPEQLNDLETVAFILEKGPVINGVAYQIGYKSRAMVTQIFKELPASRRSAINANTLRNSMAQATRTKDRDMAERAAGTARNAWRGKDPKNGEYVYLGHMSNYFKGVKDTASYLRTASAFYELYYQRLKDSLLRPYVAPSADSIAKQVKKLLTAQRKANGKADSVRIDKKYVDGRLVSVQVLDRNAPATLQVKDTRGKIIDYAKALNGAAYIFYSMGTKDPLYLSRAISWSEKTVALFPESDSYYDTLAHLYYRNDAFNAAIENQQKAVDLAKVKIKTVKEMTSKIPGMDEDAKISYKKAVDELQKMKERTL